MCPLPQTLIADYPEVLQAVRISGKWDVVLNYGDKTFYEEQVLAVDSTFFDVFSFRLLEGDPAGILREPNTVVITESIARKYFGEENAMGKMFNIIANGEEDAVRVVGVVEDVPHNVHFHFDFLLALTTFEFSREENWWNNNFKTYLVLQEGFDYIELEKKLPEFIRQYLSGDIPGWDEWVEAGNYWKYILQPLEKIHLTSDLNGEIEPNGNIQYVYIFSVVGLIILLIACINFMNLSTARSASRACFHPAYPAHSSFFQPADTKGFYHSTGFFTLRHPYTARIIGHYFFYRRQLSRAPSLFLSSHCDLQGTQPVWPW